jgi:hypothetical protein
MYAYGDRLTAGNPRFAEISGVIPVDGSTNFGHCMANFTNTSLEQNQVTSKSRILPFKLLTQFEKGRVLYSVRDVIRGFDSLESRNYADWKNATVGHLRPET